MALPCHQLSYFFMSLPYQDSLTTDRITVTLTLLPAWRPGGCAQRRYLLLQLVDLAIQIAKMRVRLGESSVIVRVDVPLRHAAQTFDTGVDRKWVWPLHPAV